MHLFLLLVLLGIYIRVKLQGYRQILNFKQLNSFLMVVAGNVMSGPMLP